MRRAILDDLRVEPEATQNVDYLSFEWEGEDIWATQNYIRRRKAQLGNYRRLENALWRAWAKQEQRLPISSTRSIQWYGILLVDVGSSNRSQAYFLRLVRDKDTDTTWLFGPWKTNAGLRSSLSRNQLRPGEFANLPSSRRSHDSGQNDLVDPGLRSILLPPLSLLVHSPPRRKARFKVQTLPIALSSPLETQFGATQISPSRPKSHRVRFSKEVQQCLCLPQTIYWDSAFWHKICKQDSISTDKHVYYLHSLLRAHKSGCTVFPLPPARLKRS